MILTIDVAHPPQHQEVVERELEDALSNVRRSSSLRIVKVIHGHGSSGKGGLTKEVVHNWAFRNRNRMRQVIHGEKYEVFDADVQAMRAEVGQYGDDDLKRNNPGITIFWVK